MITKSIKIHLLAFKLLLHANSIVYAYSCWLVLQDVLNCISWQILKPYIGSNVCNMNIGYVIYSCYGWSSGVFKHHIYMQVHRWLLLIHSQQLAAI